MTNPHLALIAAHRPYGLDCVKTVGSVRNKTNHMGVARRRIKGPRDGFLEVTARGCGLTFSRKVRQ